MEVLTARGYRERGLRTKVFPYRGVYSLLSMVELAALKAAMRKVYPDNAAHRKRWYAMYAGQPRNAMKFVNMTQKEFNYG